MTTDTPEEATPATEPNGGRRLGQRFGVAMRIPWMPLAALAIVSMLSLSARVWNLDGPCLRNCTTTSDHMLIFDEVYYVNAARVIDGLPASSHYIGAPAGTDPNAEHPQLGKLIIAAGIRVFGDTPLGWRIGAILFGSLALLGMYALVRAARGSPWLAAAVTALAAAENLLFVHARIGTLDIFVLTFMIWSAALYMRGRRVSAGVLLGAGTCVKLVAPYMFLVFILVEALRQLSVVRGQSVQPKNERLVSRVRGLVLCGVAATAVYAGGLEAMDRAVPAYDIAAQHTYSNSVAHTAHILKFAADLTAPGGAQGIASYPWQWLGDYKPIVYANVDVQHVENGHPVLISTVHFLGLVNPLILVAALPALVLALCRIWRRPEEIDILGTAWWVGMFLPFILASGVWHRISYLYYMVVILPGVILLAARMFSRPWMPRWVTALWAVGILIAGVFLFPFVALGDPNWLA
ncbi:MAG: glycosyltransferase family 39 protein [Candidatus Dormibacteria bacterium]